MCKGIENVIDYIVDGNCHKFDNNLVPSVIYGSPEIAWIGKTEQTLIKENIKVIAYLNYLKNTNIYKNISFF